MNLELYVGRIEELNVKGLVDISDRDLPEISDSSETRAEKVIHQKRSFSLEESLKIAGDYNLKSIAIPLEVSLLKKLAEDAAKHTLENPQTVVLTSENRNIVKEAEELCRTFELLENLNVLLYRKAKPQDIDQLMYLLNEGSFEEHHQGVPGWKRFAVLKNIEDYFIAETIQGEIVGVHAYTKYRPYIAYLSSGGIFVQIGGAFMMDGYMIPAFRGIGIFGRINLMIEEDAKKQGIQQLYDSSENQDAKASYERSGYKTLGKCMCCPKVRLEGCDGLVFVKDLTKQ